MRFADALPFALVALTLLVEAPAIGRKRPESERRDRGSFVLVNLVAVAAFAVSFWLSYATAFGRMGPQLALGARVLGIVFGLAGAALRTWAIATLGRYFTRTVQVSADQPVIESGPYRTIRHPSYTGLGLLFLGTALALGNWVALGLMAAACLFAGAYRIPIEEAALLQAIGEPYAAYMKRTRRLIPRLF